ncbi:UDP-N-acetylglucosamine--N-acetylmuramyl-(pentapeptide) pyrophosphoryl-undecaprenol N-acetylglucosamine transferase [Propionibacterium cyclohexanicum]|uniref:UDP-N-acetylglucosamine--N-acetylmuramyl-(pentapeptide) pyrophosphoryl-undecaprenol N-acetylglucosamine transferase n=1 Tax=Propionibacterium cyclohexanicum TaxID=64702 RepID=A0A1H9PJS6_9ACTN|nr:undecaprenyldiphospho-muramoylpentapeptide beta-N-acetylglucosaminyltransferase [Propionibacterium cyclohexanicum]SER48340.1 UDP-N-acetylglucosamine--N-acetylmuramyl-(pentapeptide) pyrophosphoryl-undecaprenol N-acetylglucosamine transferase [Propionibacterium cyclohexanicum]
MVSVVLAGGGTAGHTSPLIATAEQLRRLDPHVSLLCVGTPKGLEKRVIPEAGLELRLIPAVPLPRKPGRALLSVPGRLLGAVRQARALLHEAHADVVVGFGGYVSMPVYLAAWSARIPVVLHEQNALPGVANRVASHFAAAVLTSFPDTPLRSARQVGLPVRAAIAGLAEQGRASLRARAREHFGLRSDQPVLLVSGGSSGARSLNTATCEARDELLAQGIQILHVLGLKNFHDDPAVTDPATGAGYHPLGYLDEMDLAYAAADLMLARSGAGTVVETAVVGLPAILVPLPIGNGEQARNARPLVEAQAGIVVEDRELTGRRLVTEVVPLITDAARLQAMGAAAQRVMPPGAAQRVARIVVEEARR